MSKLTVREKKLMYWAFRSGFYEAEQAQEEGINKVAKYKKFNEWLQKRIGENTVEYCMALDAPKDKEK